MQDSSGDPQDNLPNEQRQSKHRTRNTIISILFGILVYVVLVTLVGILAGLGGIFVQLLALAVAIVLGIGMHNFLKRPPVEPPEPEQG